MSNIASLLRDEIIRLARKELKCEISSLKKSSAKYRQDVASLKRQVKKLHQSSDLLEKKILAKPVKPDANQTPLRYSAKGLITHRAKLGLSAEDYAKLAGASALSVYNWEKGKSRPRKEQIAVLAELRKIGKREAIARLKAM